jgi:mercuric ion binding protein
LKPLVYTTTLALVLIAQAPAQAAVRTVVLTIPTMDCATCPLIIKAALLRVNGVSRANVSYEHREARVTFDDSIASLAALKEATSGAGYPSFLSDSQR